MQQIASESLTLPKNSTFKPIWDRFLAVVVIRLVMNSELVLGKGVTCVRKCWPLAEFQLDKGEGFWY